MKFVDEFRDPQRALRLVEQITGTVSRRWVLMDVCGGQTHSLLRYGIEETLANCVELIHGPGCPVCVTPAEAIDTAQHLAMQPEVIVASFGDMLRVPGTSASLLACRARGGRVQIVYSPLDAVELARRHPEAEVVFFAVGFETTAPATALAILQAQQLQLSNFSVLCAHVRVLPAMEALMNDPAHRVQGFLAAGHVCTVTGYADYEGFVQRFQVPVVVTGFEPIDLLQGIQATVELLEAGTSQLVNRYDRSARKSGNLIARENMERVFQVVDSTWRGMGSIPHGGLRMQAGFAQFDARQRFGVPEQPAGLPIVGSEVCPSAQIMSGQMKPPACPHFGTTCSPDHPLGAPMVSSEGACAAYHRYQATHVQP